MLKFLFGVAIAGILVIYLMFGVFVLMTIECCGIILRGCYEKKISIDSSYKCI